MMRCNINYRFYGNASVLNIYCRNYSPWRAACNRIVTIAIQMNEIRISVYRQEDVSNRDTIVIENCTVTEKKEYTLRLFYHDARVWNRVSLMRHSHMLLRVVESIALYSLLYMYIDTLATLCDILFIQANHIDSIAEYQCGKTRHRSQQAYFGKK